MRGLALVFLLARSTAHAAQGIDLDGLTLTHEGRGYTMVRGGERLYRALPTRIKGRAALFYAPGRGPDAGASAFEPMDDGVALGPALVPEALDPDGTNFILSRTALEVYFERGRARALLVAHPKAALVHAEAALAAAVRAQPADDHGVGPSTSPPVSTQVGCEDPFEPLLGEPQPLADLVHRCEQALGHTRRASAAFEARAQTDPLGTYVAVAMDPWLAPLTLLPVLAALEHRRSSTNLLATLHTRGVLRVPGRDWVAIDRPARPHARYELTDTPRAVWLVSRLVPTIDGPAYEPSEDCESTCEPETATKAMVQLDTPARRASVEHALRRLGFSATAARVRQDVVTIPEVGNFARGLDNDEGWFTSRLDARYVPHCTVGTSRIAAERLAACLRR